MNDTDDMDGMDDMNGVEPNSGWVTVAAYEDVSGRPRPMAAVRA